MQYDWPGNVRELQNLVERLVTIKKQAVIRPKDVAPFSAVERPIKGETLRTAVLKFEKKYIRDVLAVTHGNRKAAAEILGIHRNTLLGKMNELGLKT